MKFTTALVLLFTASSLAGCGGVDDVDVTLPFVGNIMAKGKTKEEKMVKRGGLVLPPSASALPVPQQESQIAAGKSWPNDPDLQAKNAKKLAALKEAEYRKHGDWKNERSTGNGLEDFNNKVDWQKRQKGILQDGLLKQD